MSKRIIFIHGRASKPTSKDLENIWFSAVEHGLKRDFGEDSLLRFQEIKKELVYFGDLSNQFLEKPFEDPSSRFAALDELKTFPKADFNKEVYQTRSQNSALKEALADVVASVLGPLRAAEPLITAVAPDMKHYWNEESYYGSDVRFRLTKALKEAFDSGDEILLVAHSLGTIVSYDTLWKFSHYGEYRHDYGQNKKVDLFITLGSPLGDETVKRNLKGSQSKGYKKYPINIKRWYNIAAEDDFISHDSRIANDFKAMNKLNLLSEDIIDFYPIYNLTVRNHKANPHSSLGYLISPTFIELIDAWM